MKLDILVPHYKEKPDEMISLLDSIAIQQSVDFKNIGVIIAYDGPEAIQLPEQEWADKYPFNIQHIHCEHNGVSATRNAALEASDADYVMFCDADDMFSHVCGLHIIFNEMQVGFDTMVSCFIEESRLENKHIYLNHDMDSTFVHGKVHRRMYLINNNIKFNPKLTIHEDSYFNILAQNLTNRAKYCPTPFYLWKWRDASVCRHDKDYILKTYNNLLDSNDALVDEFISRAREDKAMFYVGFMVFDAYYTMNKKEWINQENQKYREAVEVRFSKYFKKHKEKWNKITQQDKMMISNGVRTRSISEGMPMETITIDNWLKHIDEYVDE